MTRDQIKSMANALRVEGKAEAFIECIEQVRQCEQKEVLVNEKIEHVKAVKAIERIFAKLRELEKMVLTEIDE